MSDLIRLKAEDVDDLNIISALLQDAVVFAGEIAFTPATRRFGLMAARFRWEEKPRTKRGLFRKAVADEPFERVRCGLHFDTVRAVRRKGFGQDEPARVLELLAITAETTDQGVTLTLSFADGASIALDAEVIDAHVSDVSEPWRTPAKPEHALDE